ncbi:hypothetical protein [Thermofilum pendens]|uniref:DUF2127 domain-containing protein n=1 Tax=Thermofilum pendens (strain DSM 2475 / Hrk 5) TaxID=368408 RepID=A1S009_THEPD|nr:hypothetical protein [Thermofilum pendens]ABL78789.1 conserved hypothetical protein [Thermofilum pendens Hrk 5]
MEAGASGSQQPQQGRKRPLGVTILAYLYLFSGIFVLGMVQAMMAENLPAETFLAWLLYGVALMATGVGFMYGMKWAWWLAVVNQSLSALIMLVLTVINDPIWLFGLFISLVVLYYVLRPHVKEFFGVEAGPSK